MRGHCADQTCTPLVLKRMKEDLTKASKILTWSGYRGTLAEQSQCQNNGWLVQDWDEFFTQRMVNYWNSPPLEAVDINRCPDVKRNKGYTETELQKENGCCQRSAMTQQIVQQTWCQSAYFYSYFLRSYVKALRHAQYCWVGAKIIKILILADCFWGRICSISEPPKISDQ